MSKTFNCGELADGKPKVYELANLTLQDKQKAKAEYNKAFAKALKDGCFLQAQSLEIATDAGIWNNEKDAELQEVQAELTTLVKKLETGGYDFEEAVQDAIRVRELRLEIRKSNLIFSQLMSHSAEGIAENAEADYLIWSRLKYKGRLVYKTFDEFLLNKDEDPVILSAIMADIGSSDEFEKQLPENEFLIEFGRMNENMEVLGKDGKPINPPEELEEQKIPTRKPFKGAPRKKVKKE